MVYETIYSSHPPNYPDTKPNAIQHDTKHTNSLNYPVFYKDELKTISEPIHSSHSTNYPHTKSITDGRGWMYSEETTYSNTIQHETKHMTSLTIRCFMISVRITYVVLERKAVDYSELLARILG
jgi:hypothetical protein